MAGARASRSERGLSSTVRREVPRLLIDAVHAHEKNHALHCRIFQDQRGELALTTRHGRKRGILRSFQNALDHARVLYREKSFGHHDIQQHGERQGARGYAEGQRLMLEDPIQFALIPDEQPIEETAPLLLLCLALGSEHDRAEHGREGQGDHAEIRMVTARVTGEFAEEPPHHVAHEQQRNQHSHQGNGQGDDCEADLARALERGLKRLFALLQVTGNIFDDHRRRPPQSRWR